MNYKQNFYNILSKLSLLYFAVVGLTVFFSFSPFMVISGLVRKKHPILSLLHYGTMFYSIKLYIFLTPLKFCIKGIENLEKSSNKPLILISNHRSHMDMFVLLSQIYRLRAVANAYIFKTPLLGQIMSLSGHFKLEKGNAEQFVKESEEIKKSVAAHDRVLFFPETTRCPTGMEGTQKFRLIPFKIAKELGASILPLAIKNTDAVWPKGIMGINFSKKIQVTVLPAVNVQDFDTVSALAKHTQKNINEALKG